MKHLNHLIDQLKRLPSIGEKSAQRLAFFLMKTDAKYVDDLATALIQARQFIKTCPQCFQLSEETPCENCQQTHLGPTILCVVENAQDILALKKTLPKDWKFHVLQGAISPVQGIGPKQLRILELEERLLKESIAEVVIATNLTPEGDVTALYLAKLLHQKKDLKISRLARGLPIGSHLEYVDQATLASAFQNRVEIQ